MRKLFNFTDKFSLAQIQGALAVYSLIVLLCRLRAVPVYGPDSFQYLSNSVIRPPGYPLILDAFQWIFGSGYVSVLVFFQILSVLVASYFLSRFLWRAFNLHSGTFFLLHVVLSLPLTSLSKAAGIFGGIGNHILSEPISYSLFLLATLFLLKMLLQKKLTDFFIALLLSALLVLMRTPMTFLFITASLAAIYCYPYKSEQKRLVRAFLLLCIAVLSVDSGERFYHAFTQGYFGKIDRAASHLLVGAVYVAQEQSFATFSPQDRKVVKKAIDGLKKRKMHATNRFELDRRLVDLYNDNFCRMQSILEKSFKEVNAHNAAAPRQEILFYTSYEEFARRAAPVLVLNNIKEFGKLTLLKFLYSLQFREGVFIGLLMLLPVCKFRRELQIWGALILLLLVMNRLMMAPIIFLGDRYLFYTDILEYAFFLIFADNILRSKIFIENKT